MIYLIGKERFFGVKNLILNRLEFMPLNVNLAEFNALIITSKNALIALEKSKIKPNSAIKLYAVGKESQKYAQKLGFTQIKIPQKAYGKDLARAFTEELRGEKCLYLRAKTIASNLDKELIDAGVNLVQIIAYENKFCPPKEPLKLEKPAVFIFLSPFGVKNFLTLYQLDEKDKCVAIGTTTAKALPSSQSVFVPKIQSIKACVALARTLKQKV